MSGLRLDAGGRSRLLGAVRLLGSNQPGEVSAALAAINRILPDGMGLADLVERAITPVTFAPPGPAAARGAMSKEWIAVAVRCSASPTSFNDREACFLDDMLKRASEPSPAQWSWLRSLADRLDGRRAA